MEWGEKKTLETSIYAKPQKGKKGRGGKKKKTASPFSGATNPLSGFMNLTWWRKPELFSQPA